MSAASLHGAKVKPPSMATRKHAARPLPGTKKGNLWKLSRGKSIIGRFSKNWTERTFEANPDTNMLTYWDLDGKMKGVMPIFNPSVSTVESSRPNAFMLTGHSREGVPDSMILAADREDTGLSWIGDLRTFAEADTIKKAKKEVQEYEDSVNPNKGAVEEEKGGGDVAAEATTNGLGVDLEKNPPPPPPPKRRVSLVAEDGLEFVQVTAPPPPLAPGPAPTGPPLATSTEPAPTTPAAQPAPTPAAVKEEKGTRKAAAVGDTGEKKDAGPEQTSAPISVPQAVRNTDGIVTDVPQLVTGPLDDPLPTLPKPISTRGAAGSNRVLDTIPKPKDVPEALLVVPGSTVADV